MSFILSSVLNSHASDNNTLIKGYITNKKVNPVKLKISHIDEGDFFSVERNLDDESLIPQKNLKINAINEESYTLLVEDKLIYIPKATKFFGKITEVHAAKKFDRKGFYNVVFDQVQCPDGKLIELKSGISSKSLRKSYNPASHLGKTTLGLLGGALIGTFFAYKIGGITGAIASEGYSLAAGAALGGAIGATGALISSGKDATIQPGDGINILPIDSISLDKLEQISCSANNTEIVEEKEIIYSDDVNLKVLGVKKKKNFFGNIVKVNFEFDNNTDKEFRLSHFYLIDSQGKEYIPTIIDPKTDSLSEFKPNETIITSLDFFVDYPKATHWLILRKNDYSKEIGRWKVID